MRVLPPLATASLAVIGLLAAGPALSQQQPPGAPEPTMAAPAEVEATPPPAQAPAPPPPETQAPPSPTATAPTPQQAAPEQVPPQPPGASAANTPAPGDPAGAGTQGSVSTGDANPEATAQGTKAPTETTNGATAAPTLQQALDRFYEAPPDLNGTPRPRPNEVASNADMVEELSRSDNPSELTPDTTISPGAGSSLVSPQAQGQ